MKIFNDIKNSIYSPAYYRGLLEKPFGYSLKYYVSFATVFSLAMAVVLFFAAAPGVARMVDTLASQIPERFPQELVVKVENGLVSTNVQEPYAIPMPQEFRSEQMRSDGADVQDFKNLVVIDTRGDSGMASIAAYDSAMVITRDSIISYDGKGGFSVQPISKEANILLDRGEVAVWVNKMKPYARFIYPLMAVGIFIMGMVALVLAMGYAALAALLVWFFLRTRGIAAGYGKAYQMVLHLLTLGILVSGARILVDVLTGYSFDIPFLVTIILAISAFVNINKEQGLGINNH